MPETKSTKYITKQFFLKKIFFWKKKKKTHSPAARDLAEPACPLAPHPPPLPQRWPAAPSRAFPSHAGSPARSCESQSFRALPLGSGGARDHRWWLWCKRKTDKNLKWSFVTGFFRDDDLRSSPATDKRVDEAGAVAFNSKKEKKKKNEGYFKMNNRRETQTHFSNEMMQFLLSSPSPFPLASPRPGLLPRWACRCRRWERQLQGTARPRSAGDWSAARMREAGLSVKSKGRRTRNIKTTTQKKK